MTLELVLAVSAIINCIAAVASAVIATLSYLKNKKSEKRKPPSLDPLWRLHAKNSGDDRKKSGISFISIYYRKTH